MNFRCALCPLPLPSLRLSVPVNLVFPCPPPLHQVQLAQLEYQLPRLTRMWTHLERQAGGMVKGMGEKQIEVDKRIIRERMAALRRSLTSVREHRQQHRDRRAGLPIPVLSLVGYTNAGKSTLLNRLTGAGVLAEDKLFATLDPTTRRTQLPNGKECLLTDTVGFIQKLPTQLVAAFRATLEEITEASVLLHVVDVSHPMAAQQVAAVLQVLAELEVSHIPMLTVLNKVDQVSPDWLQQQQRQLEAILDQNLGGRESSAGGRDRGGREGGRHRMVAVSAVTGEGMDGLFHELEKMVNVSQCWSTGTWLVNAPVIPCALPCVSVPVMPATCVPVTYVLSQGLLVSIEAIIPYQEGHLLGLVYQLGAVDSEGGERGERRGGSGEDNIRCCEERCGGDGSCSEMERDESRMTTQEHLLIARCWQCSNAPSLFHPLFCLSICFSTFPSASFPFPHPHRSIYLKACCCRHMCRCEWEHLPEGTLLSAPTGGSAAAAAAIPPSPSSSTPTHSSYPCSPLFLPHRSTYLKARCCQHMCRCGWRNCCSASSSVPFPPSFLIPFPSFARTGAPS
ncbi:unnamed protein product [Closterium sp. Naga37s-1]|nr:unnamed protein product [Closterium sp. Naga37s-1]